MAVNASLNGPDPIDVAVGLRLRRLRKERNMSQIELGEALGVSFQQIQKYERGSNRISASMMVRAANSLGVSPCTLLPEENDPAPKSPAIMAMMTELRGADDLLEAYANIPSPELRRALLGLARSLAPGKKA
jgi:transcriptional regulator with XRE-family HTH domain